MRQNAPMHNRHAELIYLSGRIARTESIRKVYMQSMTYSIMPHGAGRTDMRLLNKMVLRDRLNHNNYEKIAVWKNGTWADVGAHI